MTGGHSLRDFVITSFLYVPSSREKAYQRSRNDNLEKLLGSEHLKSPLSPRKKHESRPTKTLSWYVFCFFSPGGVNLCFYLWSMTFGKCCKTIDFPDHNKRVFTSHFPEYVTYTPKMVQLHPQIVVTSISTVFDPRNNVSNLPESPDPMFQKIWSDRNTLNYQAKRNFANSISRSSVIQIYSQGVLIGHGMRLAYQNYIPNDRFREMLFTFWINHDEIIVCKNPIISPTSEHPKGMSHSRGEIKNNAAVRLSDSQIPNPVL